MAFFLASLRGTSGPCAMPIRQPRIRDLFLLAGTGPLPCRQAVGRHGLTLVHWLTGDERTRVTLVSALAALLAFFPGSLVPESASKP